MLPDHLPQRRLRIPLGHLPHRHRPPSPLTIHGLFLARPGRPRAPPRLAQPRRPRRRLRRRLAALDPAHALGHDDGLPQCEREGAVALGEVAVGAEALLGDAPRSAVLLPLLLLLCALLLSISRGGGRG